MWLVTESDGKGLLNVFLGQLATGIVWSVLLMVFHRR